MPTTVVRMRPAPRPTLDERRGFVERVSVVYAGFAPRFVRAAMALPHGRIRRALVQRVALAVTSTFNRRDFDLVPLLFSPAGGGRVVLLNEMHGRVRGSEAEINQPEAQRLVFDEDGRIVALDQYWSWDEALSAAGL